MVNAWAGLGHVVGAGVRRIGTVRTDMAPEERRDGGALVWLVLAVLIAAVEWWNLRGVDATFISMPASWVHAVVGGTFGFMALVLPVFCLFFAWRAFRHPTETQANNRIAIGLMALTVAGSGIAHIAGGQPQLNQGFEAIWRAGGFVGFLAADPLSALVTHWGALVVLAVLAFLAVLVMTATPVGQIGPRLRDGYDKLMGQGEHRTTDVSDPEHDRSYLDPASPQKKRGKRQTRAERRREKAQLDAYNGDEAFERAVVDEAKRREAADGSSSTRVFDLSNDGAPSGSTSSTAAGAASAQVQDTEDIPSVRPGVKRPTKSQIAADKLRREQGLEPAADTAEASDAPALAEVDAPESSRTHTPSAPIPARPSSCSLPVTWRTTCRTPGAWCRARRPRNAPRPTTAWWVH